MKDIDGKESTMKTPKMAFSAAGDMLIQRLIPIDYDGFD